MYMVKITNDYDKTTSSKYENYDNMTLTNCTYNENNIDKLIPTLFYTIPCGLSCLYFMSLIVYTLIKPLIMK